MITVPAVAAATIVTLPHAITIRASKNSLYCDYWGIIPLPLPLPPLCTHHTHHLLPIATEIEFVIHFVIIRVARTKKKRSRVTRFFGCVKQQRLSFKLERIQKCDSICIESTSHE